MADATEVPVVETAEEKTAREIAQAKADEVNKTRAGKGTRIRVGQTRGQNSQVISWEAFDDSLPDTLPATLSEFMDITKTQDEKILVGYLLEGFNAKAYEKASDPIAAFVNAAWPEDVQKSFRLAVRNVVASTDLTLEDAVGMIKPQVEKKLAKPQA